jgi:hypothetical protein
MTRENQEIVERVSHEKGKTFDKLHRCEICWIDSEHKYMDNGFIPIELPYHHATFCPHKRVF